MLADAEIGERWCGSICDPHLVLIAASPLCAICQQPSPALRGHQLPDAALGLFRCHLPRPVGKVLADAKLGEGGLCGSIFDPHN
jgi:hypothetical protein